MSCLELVYAEASERDRLLKDIAIKAAVSHVKELVSSRESADLCKNNGEIEFDVLTTSFSSESTSKSAKQLTGERWLQCASPDFVSGPKYPGLSLEQMYHCSQCNRHFP
jgi:transposase-like protein